MLIIYSNCSGLLTTFGGSQEVFSYGRAAAGCTPVGKRREPPEAARNEVREELSFIKKDGFIRVIPRNL
jgi:hypothetical protein